MSLVQLVDLEAVEAAVAIFPQMDRREELGRCDGVILRDAVQKRALCGSVVISRQRSGSRREFRRPGLRSRAPIQPRP